MKTIEMFKPGILILIGIFLIGSLVIASADESLLEGGDSFNNAVQIEPVSYDCTISKDNPDYYKIINITPGQKLIIKAGIPAVESGSANRKMELSLYDEENQQLMLDKEHLIPDEIGTLTVFRTTSSIKSSNIFYLKIQEEIRTTDDPYSYTLDISIEDCFDADSQTDAGNIFDTALEITPGDYKGYLEIDDGDDDKDIYVISMQSGENLDVTITPKGYAKFKVIIYDQDRVKASEEISANNGAIVRTSYNSSISQDIYLEINKRLISSDKEYSLVLALEAEEVTETESTESATEKTSVEEASTEEVSIKDTHTEEASGDDSEGLPGFGVVFALGGLLTVICLLMRR
ncbi:MAG: PGF-CTERM sorting domain-containing protein [ANME-2 cluster archaeon]|nr:PGF-CTERM sorting domain-containing protein [ANME-2 cluster archaeon]MBC2701712.1 PGF-CTERM sorting domain-containing protein [ANME-2 cluster archaeon]MBC2709164.1 PGF-CTERM sorting domain-containing protein [ANME-2 cluster archaeon]MBC2745916.1 PGF-CTERM sorting domain-containing protein [ANME-2 cluster archaeon]